MSISGLSTTTLQSLLLGLNSGTSSASSNSTSSLLSTLTGNTNSSSAATSLSTSADASPAYVLSSGQKQSESQLFSYSNLGKLIGTTDNALSSLIAQNGSAQAVDGNGKPLTTGTEVSVSQLATAQAVSSSSFADETTQVFGTGTLTVTGANGATTPVSITDGSLGGVVKAINDASAGITAQVVQNPDSSYHLEITGSATGANNQFTLSGISDLTYDPSSGSGALQSTTKAQDAAYTVNGTQKTSPTNDNVTVAPGVTTSFTATGTQTVTSSVGQSAATQSASGFVADFNAMISGLPSGEQASSSSSSSSQSSTIGDLLAQVAGQSFNVAGSQKTLADIGITVGSDGTLTLDQTKLQSAYASDPSAVSGVITQAAQAVKSALSQNGGISDQVQSTIGTLVTQLANLPSLADYLSGGSSSSSSGSTADQLLSGMSA